MPLNWTDKMLSTKVPHETLQEFNKKKKKKIPKSVCGSNSWIYQVGHNWLGITGILNSSVVSVHLACN